MLWRGRGGTKHAFFSFFADFILSMSIEKRCRTPLHTHAHQIPACQSTHKCNFFFFFFFSVTVAHNASYAFKGSLWFHQGGWRNLKKLVFSEEKTHCHHKDRREQKTNTGITKTFRVYRDTFSFYSQQEIDSLHARNAKIVNNGVSLSPSFFYHIGFHNKTPSQHIFTKTS
ncbi:unnamed protein product [Ixodes persulcatus]